MGAPQTNTEALEKLIAEATASGGSEMSNYQLFVMRLTGALGLPQPEFAREETRFDDYVFERNFALHGASGANFSSGIDCYATGCLTVDEGQSAKRR